MATRRFVATCAAGFLVSQIVELVSSLILGLVVAALARPAGYDARETSAAVRT